MELRLAKPIHVWDVDRYFPHFLPSHSFTTQQRATDAKPEMPPPFMEPDVRHRFHKSPLLYPVLSQINPVHCLPFSL